MISNAFISKKNLFFHSVLNSWKGLMAIIFLLFLVLKMFWGTPTPNLWLGEWVDLYVSRVGWVDIRKVGTASETVSRFKISRAWQWQLTSNSCPTACLTAKMSMAGVRGRKAWKGNRKYTSLSYSLGLSQSGICGQKEVLAGIPYPLPNPPLLFPFSLSPIPFDTC